MGDISKNFSFSEFERSDTAKKYGYDNSMNKIQRIKAKYLVLNVLQPSRDYLKFGIKISSGYRCLAVNNKVGGSTTSQHTKGEAADLKCQDNAKLFEYIRNNLKFDQLIWEYGDNKQPAWVHVSYSESINRKQVMRKYKGRKYINI